MKKGLIRVLSIINFIFIAGVVAILFLGAYRVGGFGEWLLNTWNNIFSQSQSIETLWDTLPKVGLITLSVMLGYGIILFICDEVCYSEHCEIDDPATVEEKTEPVTDEENYRLRVVLGRKKTENKKGDDNMKSFKERKAAREAKKAAKKIKTAAVEDAEKEVKAAETNVDSAISSFLNKLKK